MSADWTISVTIGGKAWSNWTGAELDSDMLVAADTWRVAATAPTREQLDNLQLGQAVEVAINGQVALRGTLESVIVSSDSGGLMVELAGRDLAGALVDCSLPPAEAVWREMSLESVANNILRQLAPTVTVEAVAEAKEVKARWTQEPGESVWQFLERSAKPACALVWLTPDSVLHIGRPDYTSAPVATLTHGKNTKSLHYAREITGRFNPLTVLGQARTSPLGESSSNLRGSAADDDLGLFRPGTVSDSDVNTRAEATARAVWEVGVRKARAEQLSVRVAGAGPTRDVLWTPNTMVSVVDSVLGTTGLWWLAKRRIQQDREQGTQTTLELRRPNAWRPEV